MTLSRAAITDWYWAGGPGRRLLVSLLITLVVVMLPSVLGGTVSTPLFALFIGWDLGAWFMDRVYLDRLFRQQPSA